MAFINQAVTVLQTLVIALGAGLAVWGVVNLMEGYGNDNPGVHTEGIMNFLLNEAKRQDIGTILTRDTSRISRDTSSFMRFERKFRENGIRFEYLSKPDNELPVTPMMEAFAAAYKKRRTKNGTRA